MFDSIRRHGRRLATAAAATGVAAALILGAAATAHASGATVWRITTVATLALDVSGGSTASGAPVIQWPINGGQNQQWTLWNGSHGTLIVNGNSGQCLSVAGASLAAGAPVVQYPCADVAYQEWTLVPVNSGTAYLFVNANSGQVLDVPGGTGNWGTQLEQWPANGNPNQYFWFYQLS